ncbi:hypothetical protein UCRPC4_g03197 [Phaeomoniella chlamydospora]|uniref:Uncharacterized protein n=1 Tax=Phaeomoniella chlamydospora TaxID=158046 RepID=A0A0G2EK02_PHACM|nr:hypothetical protein UCRPC4_g03197 [Phaeomoniella chlamydospora]
MGRTSRNRRSGGNPSARNEFDGEVQYLPAPSQEEIAIRERNLPILSTHLDVKEQDRILGEVEKQLTESAYFFFARWQFPIPVERDKRPVHDPEDREWNEWVHVLKRLATKRRIPARVLYNGQIKQFITVLENSLEMRHAVKHTSRPCKDDRNILQLISAGTQVAKIFKDAYAMEILNRLYKTTESTIEERRNGERIQNTRKMEEGPMRGCGTNQLDRSYPFKSGVIKSSAGFATIHCGQTIPSPESRGPNHIDMDPRSTAASSNIHYAKV